MNLTKLPTPQPCAIECSTPNDEAYCCRKPAHWSVDDTPVCEDDMRTMAGMNSDNSTFFAPALAEYNLANFFAHLSENLALIETDLELDLSDIHTVEIIPGVPNADGRVDDWWMHLNDEMFAEVWRNYSGKCEVVLSGYYSDYEDMYAQPQPTNA